MRRKKKGNANAAFCKLREFCVNSWLCRILALPAAAKIGSFQP
jgi:hypothetical protein